MNSIKKLYGKLVHKMGKNGKKKIAVGLIAVIVLSGCLTVYNSIAESHLDYMIVTLNYEGAKQGLNPDGSRFKINEIKSDEVLKNAISMLGDNTLSVDGAKSRISIDSKMPLSAIENTTNAIASGSNYRYNPSEFDIYYSQKKKLGKNNTIDFIVCLSKAYEEYFLDKYSEKNNILLFDSGKNFENYDYYEINTILNDKINSMISYLGKHQEESPTYRSADTGYTFENLVNSLINLQNQDLEKYESYVVQNSISKDNRGFVRKQEYLANELKINYDSGIQSSEIARDALETYDPRITGVAFIPSVDGFDEYYMSRTKTGLDNLAIKSYNKGISANGVKEKIDELNYLSDKFSTSSKTAGGTDQKADEMIEDICKYLEKISAVAVATDNDYLSYKTKDYITFNLPEKGFNFPVADFVKNFVVIAVVLLLGYRAYLFAVDTIKKKKVAEKLIDKLDLKED